MNKTKWKEKLENFRVRLSQEPHNGILWFEYGDFLDEECDNPDKTIYAFEKARDLLPDADVRLRLGAAYDRGGQSEKGISLIRESLKENPRPHGYCILADVYIKNGMYQDAISACEKALELEPDFEEAYYLLGNATKHKSRNKAVEYYREAVRLDSEYQLAWQALGSLLTGSKGTVEDGISALRKASELDAEDGWARIFIANALWMTGKNKEADEQYKLAIDTFPEYSEFRKWYAEFLEKVQKT